MITEPHGTPESLDDPSPSRREQFGRDELVQVLSHYDLGVISRIREFPRGSRRAPKVIITASHGEFLLKRRATGRDDPFRVAFAHTIQLHLAARGFPIAELIGTRDHNNSLLQLDGRTYELFVFKPGRHANRSTRDAEQAGVTLGSMHRLLADCQPAYDSPVGSFHGVAGASAVFGQIPGRVQAIESDVDASALRRTCNGLARVYEEAGDRVTAAGFEDWAPEIIHGDFHPGNLLFDDSAVIALLDFDSARLEPRIADVANGVLQFSMDMTDHADPRAWPEDLDVNRLTKFVAGYSEAAAAPLTDAEIDAIPWLIAETLIMESAVPIANTGRFARLAGSSFLTMVETKIRWLRPRASRLARLLKEHA